LVGMIFANAAFDVVVAPTGYRLIRKSSAQTRRGNPTFINPMGLQSDTSAERETAPLAASTARFILAAGCALTLAPLLLVMFFWLRQRLNDFHLSLAIFVAALALIAKDLAWIVILQVTDIYTAL